MGVATLDHWKIEVVTIDNKRRPLFSGFVNDQKTRFFAKSFDYIRTAIISECGKVYKLGTTHPEYERQFPNAKKKLLSTLRNNRKRNAR